MECLVAVLDPQLVLVVESGFWVNCFKALRLRGVNLVLMNGKISQRSARRLAYWLPILASELLNAFELCCVQSAEHKERFCSLSRVNMADRIVVTANLKEEVVRPADHEIASMREVLKLKPQERLVVIASTHPGEERLLFQALAFLIMKYGNKVKWLFAPRHPERFESVYQLLNEGGRGVGRISSSLSNNTNLFLLDQIGSLVAAYALAQVAIVGGSFVPKIGGHNILEPPQMGCAVFFGPYMQEQQDLVRRVLAHGLGKQLELVELVGALDTLLMSDSSPFASALEIYQKKQFSPAQISLSYLAPLASP